MGDQIDMGFPEIKKSIPAAERQKAYEARKRRKGYTRVAIWVKDTDVEKLKEFSASLSA